jgi:hypothetical protein
MTGGSEVDAGVAVFLYVVSTVLVLSVLAVHLARITRRPPEE